MDHQANGKGGVTVTVEALRCATDPVPTGMLSALRAASATFSSAGMFPPHTPPTEFLSADHNFERRFGNTPEARHNAWLLPLP